MSLTKIDIISKISEQVSCTRSDAAEYIEEVLQIIKTNLAAGNEVKISGFGKFKVKQKSSRLGRNPQTGDRITITPRQIVTFKVSSKLREELEKYQR